MELMMRRSTMAKANESFIVGDVLKSMYTLIEPNKSIQTQSSLSHKAKEKTVITCKCPKKGDMCQAIQYILFGISKQTGN